VTALIAPALLSVIAIVALVLSGEFGLWSFGTPGAGLMPASAATLLLCASLADLRFPRDMRRWPVLAWRPASYIVGLVSLMALTPLIGMLPALALSIFAVLYFVERLPALHAPAIAGVAAVGSWLLFERLLSVPLPKPLFW
jgi:putative tricarboxylic transport membrane protein